MRNRVVAIAAVVVASVLLLPPDNPDDAAPPPCVQINVFFRTDEGMARAADRLRTDDDVSKVATETRQQMFERFRHAYADQPELVELTRPEAIPARVGVKPVRNVDHNVLANRLREMFSPDGDVQDPCVDTDRRAPR